MFTPPAAYHRRARRLNNVGYDVAVLRLNLVALGTAVGGSYYDLSKLEVTQKFGPRTDECVRLYQRLTAGLVEDGIAGYMTDRALSLDLMRPAQSRYHILPGLMKGLTEGEAGYDGAAFARGIVDGIDYVDAGLTMQHLRRPDWTETKFRAAFDGARAYDRLGRTLRAQRDKFTGSIGPFFIDPRERPWFCAILYWNWQSAAARYSEGQHNWQYYETLPDGEKVMRWMDEDAYWISKFKIPGVTTGHDWAKRYVQSKTQYVTAWTN
jgi:hypothetical protein